MATQSIAVRAASGIAEVAVRSLRLHTMHVSNLPLERKKRDSGGPIGLKSDPGDR